MIRNKNILIIFLVFFGIMLLQQRYIYLYHDDYGYASLSYAVSLSTPVHGHTYSIPQFLEFLEKHYRLWGGRVLFFGFEILSLRWGLWVYRIMQALVLTTILGLIYKIVNQDGKSLRDHGWNALLLCCFYGLIGIEIHRNGTYWATAAAIYVWPFVALLGAIVLHTSWVESSSSSVLSIVIFSILYFLSGWSQEQFGLISMTVILSLIGIHLKRKTNRKVIAVDMICLLCVLIGYAILIMAPGNQARSNYSIYEHFYRLHWIDKIKYNLLTIIFFMTGPHNRWFLILWAWASGMAMYVSYRTHQRQRWVFLVLFIICMIFGGLISLSFIAEVHLSIPWMYQAVGSIKYLLFWGTYLSATCLATVLFCFEQGSFVLLSIFIGGMVSQALMIGSPSLSIRSDLLFLFTLFPVLVAMGLKIKSSPFIKPWIFHIAVLVLFISAISNTIFLIRGYALNDPVMSADERILESSSRAASNGAAIQTIELEKLIDDRFGGEMPYAPGYGYINAWIKEYYDLPADVELIWK